MSQRFARFRIALAALTLAASVTVGYAQTSGRSTASPERGARPKAVAADTAGTAVAETRAPRHPVVNDARLTASPRVRYLGPAGTTSPFGSNMTESQCTAMENCEVVQGQGPSYATWCRCGKGKLTTFTYIHD